MVRQNRRSVLSPIIKKSQPVAPMTFPLFLLYSVQRHKFLYETICLILSYKTINNLFAKPSFLMIISRNHSIQRVAAQSHQDLSNTYKNRSRYAPGLFGTNKDFKKVVFLAVTIQGSNRYAADNFSSLNSSLTYT